ncbi:MAG: hypothetical protein SOR11_12600 [Fusobacterium sp.]|uniref:hypothetical protein n=1 Tax=Fusobacterium sp. TaxID=68766 RepID=UPI002941E089|nr:hypothetical protein [Fusobacterium sp.]MDY3060817.1 hypothetical protein [Fusobacterium sp.]
MSLYEINLQREILREKSAEILADFHRYMEEKNIEQFDLNIPIGILHKVVGGIYRNIFKSEYETREKIDEANGKLDLAKEILKNSYLERKNYIKFKEFYEEYTKLSFLDFEELISNAKDEKEKLFFNMLLQYSMENNFNKVLRKEKY